MQPSLVAELLRQVRSKKPLVHHITNVVTVSDCANATLFIGGLPVMANSPDEAEEMVRLAQALVLNIGTLHREQIDAMLRAGREANAREIPIVLDPVGAGATTYRTKTALLLLEELKIAVIKGNAGETATLAGVQAEVRGVESGRVDDILAPAATLSAATGAVVAVTGARDLVLGGDDSTWIDGGSARMSTFVGSGCVAASLVGCFVGANPARVYEATVAALTVYRKAAERAATGAPAGPVAFRNAVYRELAAMTPERLAE